MKMKVEIITKETVKPSSPTPNHLRTFKFSLLDQLAPTIYTQLVLLYSATSPDSQCLKNSLSEVLTQFHPFAGRIKDHFTVDCNDDGADYIEARINCNIADVLQQLRMETLKLLVPTISDSKTSTTANPLLLVQLTFFDCGGMALGISFSHKIADGGTIGAFLMSWAATAVGSSSTVLPDFTAAASLLPPSEHLPTKSLFSGETRLNGIPRRYVFDSDKIGALKARSVSPTVPKPTRVEAVSALICKCAMAVSKSKLGGCPYTKLLLYKAVNLRARFDPPLPKYSFGNIVGPLPVLLDYEPSETKSKDELPDIVSQLRNGILEFDDSFVKKLQGDDYLEVYCNKYEEVEEMREREDIDFHILNSWCNFPFYESDFGWGKPIWASPVLRNCIPNRIRLMDTRDGGGIEAWVTFNEDDDIALFEGNPEWFEFASLNPSVDLNN